MIKIDNKIISNNSKTYFIADIAANHDGSLDRAKKLIYLAAESGADAAKFQHFKAENIVSDKGFRQMGSQKSHQSEWKKSVFKVYEDASLNLDWTCSLKEVCDDAGISFLTSPYDFDLVDHVEEYVSAYKIGSGDITWIEIIEYIAKKQKPYIIASGASTFDEVDRAVSSALRINSKLCLMQCNTNYTASLENFKYIQLNVINSYKFMYPELVLGLSDHTPYHSRVLGAVSLGARVIEKHFTDSVDRVGPDHKFSMDPSSWREMVCRTRELENALGSGVKRVEDNEKETVVLQRRSILSISDLEEGTILNRDSIKVLRPCPTGSISPNEITKVLGKRLKSSVSAGECIKWEILE